MSRFQRTSQRNFLVLVRGQCPCRHLECHAFVWKRKLSARILDSTAAAQLPTVHEQGWRIVFQQKQLDRVAALSSALPIVNDHMAFQKILQELGEDKNNQPRTEKWPRYGIHR